MSNQSKKKVLVTGASGLLGVAAIDRFLDGAWDVVGVSRRKSAAFPLVRNGFKGPAASAIWNVQLRRRRTFAGIPEDPHPGWSPVANVH